MNCPLCNFIGIDENEIIGHLVSDHNLDGDTALLLVKENDGQK